MLPFQLPNLNTFLEKENIKAYQALIDKSISRSEKYQFYTELLTYLKQYYKYKTVAILLGSKDIPEIDITEVEIKNQLKKLKEKARLIL